MPNRSTPSYLSVGVFVGKRLGPLGFASAQVLIILQALEWKARKIKAKPARPVRFAFDPGRQLLLPAANRCLDVFAP